jgi:hypothetical protein
MAMVSEALPDNSGTVPLPLDGLVPGTYFVQLRQNGKVASAVLEKR